MKLKSKWQKLLLLEKIMIILFFFAMFFLISGIIILSNIKVKGFLNGFNLIHFLGVIPSLTYYEPANLINLIFLKIGIIFTIFLMPLTSGTSIILFITSRLI